MTMEFFSAYLCLVALAGPAAKSDPIVAPLFFILPDTIPWILFLDESPTQ